MLFAKSRLSHAMQCIALMDSRDNEHHHFLLTNLSNSSDICRSLIGQIIVIQFVMRTVFNPKFQIIESTFETVRQTFFLPPFNDSITNSSIIPCIFYWLGTQKRLQKFYPFANRKKKTLPTTRFNEAVFRLNWFVFNHYLSLHLIRPFEWRLKRCPH